MLYTNIIALLLCEKQMIDLWRFSDENNHSTRVQKILSYTWILNNGLMLMSIALFLSSLCRFNIQKPLVSCNLVIQTDAICRFDCVPFWGSHLEYQGTVWPQHVATTSHDLNKTFSEEPMSSLCGLVLCQVWQDLDPSTVSCWGLGFTHSVDSLFHTCLSGYILQIHHYNKSLN